MKKLLLLITLAFTITSAAQYTIVSAVDVKDGMEDQYLALEAFFGPVHDLAIEKGMLNFQGVFKVVQTSDDRENVADYFIISGFSSKEQLDAYLSTSAETNMSLAKEAHKGKMSRRSIQRMLDQTGSESKERRTYQIKGVAATILAGGDIKKGDKMSVNFMNKKTDDFENFETQVWKPVAEKNILAGNLRQWILVEAIGRSENAYSGWTHLVFNVQAENPGDPVMMSGFKWDKLWEGIESSRDMSEADELVCVYSMN
jgi:hypothetical protein